MQNFISVRSTCTLVVWNKKLPFTMKAVNFNRKWYERCLVVCFLYASSWASMCFIKKSLIIWLFPLMRISVIPRIVSWVFSAYIGYFPNCFAYFTASIGKSWKRYIPSKMSHFGMKFRESQSIKSVKSKDTNYDQNYPKYKTTIRIVLRLCRDLLHQTFRVYTDTPA